MKRTSAVVLAAALALTGAGLAACSSSGSDSSSSEDAMVGDNPGTWAPVEIGEDANGTTIDLVVGQAARFTYWPEGGAAVESSDPAVVEASQPGTEGGAEMVAGLVAKAPGTATVKVFYPDEPADQGGASNIVMEFTVNVAAE